MKIDIFKHEDNWQEIKDSTMNTIGKTTGKYPTSEWKRKLILAEHSPIRRMKFYWRWKELKSWVSVHMVRHKIGIEHWDLRKEVIELVLIETNCHKVH